MKRNFVELQNFLSQRYPELEGSIGGETYPPPAYATLAVGFAGFVQMAAIALMFFGSKIFEVFGIPEPEWYDQVKNNKMMTFASVFMLNSMANSLTATGAFEVTVDGAYCLLPPTLLPSFPVCLLFCIIKGPRPRTLFSFP